MTVAFLFPGQGAETARSGPPWLAASPETRRLLEEAARQAGVAFDRLFAAGGQALEDTALHQPVLTALCLGIRHELARRGVRPDIVAGHSLGEVAACAAAGCLEPVDAVRLAALRGRLMAREAARYPGGMLAVTTAEPAVADEALAVARAHGLAALAAHNSPEQWVVSGEWDALRAVAARFPATPVPVAGPWHTAAMAGAAEEYRAALRTALRGPLRVPLACNRTGALADAAALPDLLADQLTHPVEWVAVMRTLGESGVTDVVVVGPGKALRGLARRNLGADTRLHAAELPDDLGRLAEELAR